MEKTPKHLVFSECERGYMLRTNDGDFGGLPGKMWAFDDIHKLAAWLTENYSGK